MGARLVLSVFAQSNTGGSKGMGSGQFVDGQMSRKLGGGVATDCTFTYINSRSASDKYTGNY